MEKGMSMRRYLSGLTLTAFIALILSTACDRSARSAATASAAEKENSSKPKETLPNGDNSMTRLSKSGYDITPLPRAKVEELASRLDREAYQITQRAGTEPAFCGGLLDNKKDGVYACAVCDLPLFSSEQKFNSGTGWPSFYAEFDPQHVSRKTDSAHGMTRTEINCARCGSHLGHVFDDGPKPSGERHCLNSASLKFYDKGTEPKPHSTPRERAG
jgi:methionine-R-sulfoxide reductase